MNLEQLCQKLSMQVRTAPNALETPVTGAYASDLLSCVMAKAQPGNVWITLQTHANIVAVASLLDLAAIIVAEGAEPDLGTLEKAEQQGIPLLTSELTTYTVSGMLYEIGLKGPD